MEIIRCIHPKEKIEIKSEIVKTTDILLKREKPEAFCNQCKTYLPSDEEPAKSIINFWFIKQDGKVRAVATT